MTNEIMTIDEAIKHCEKVASGHERNCEIFADDPELSAINREWADNYHNIAEWLKEAKAYKDFKEKGYVMCRFEVAQDDRHRTTKMVLDFSTKELFNNIVEVNADDRN